MGDRHAAARVETTSLSEPDGSVAVGLVLAGGIVLARGAITDAKSIALAVGVFALLMFTKINPAIPIVASGLIGIALYMI
jgi:chromate transport protein ChrA